MRYSIGFAALFCFRSAIHWRNAERKTHWSSYCHLLPFVSLHSSDQCFVPMEMDMTIQPILFWCIWETAPTTHTSSEKRVSKSSSAQQRFPNSRIASTSAFRTESLTRFTDSDKDDKAGLLGTERLRIDFTQRDVAVTSEVVGRFWKSSSRE